MTEQEKARKVAELLTAWADGKKLQHLAFFSQIKDQIFIDYKDNMLPEINSSNIECWRVKPEPKKQWYQLALMKDSMNVFHISVVNNENHKRMIKTSDFFVKWFTNVIEYEVTSE